MVLDRPKYRRQSIRLQGYDYSLAGAYFVTICTQRREPLFGDVRDGEMILNDAGDIVEWAWLRLPERFPGIDVDEMTVMPNHIHGVLFLGDALTPPLSVPKATNLAGVVRAFKSITARHVNVLLGRGDRPVWQRNYYEHIVRNDEELNRIRQYILDNPANWDDAEENIDRR